MKISKREYPLLVGLMQGAFPDYRGRKFRLEQKDCEFDVYSYWDGGSKDEYIFVRADGLKMLVSSLEAPWVQGRENRRVKLVMGLACVRHTYFCGHDMGLTLMMCSEDMPKMIENKA